MSTEQIPKQFSGYAALSEEEGKKLDVEPYSFTPKTWSEDDVTLKITHCGICGSCIHTLTNGWPFPTKYPAICGHEVVGIVVEAGSNTRHKVGDRVGVGAQSISCGECRECKAGKEPYCLKMGGTYQGIFEDGTMAQGGYSNYMRTKGAFAVPIPSVLKSEVAAPLLCAGITTYSPLKRFGASPGKKVGVLGIGGLGHLGLMFSKALGANTYAFSSSNGKLDDVVKMGIPKENYISYSNPQEVIDAHRGSFDLIISTSSGKGMPLESLFFELLAPEGVFCLLGMPEEKFPAMFGQAFAMKGIQLAGSMIGGPRQIEEMLNFAADNGVKPWVEVKPMHQASQALKEVHAGKPRYRYVLANPDFS
ncbi:GroES-like protein [Atractiella rhizophila]|nr:GroES-like protein [Atractiella rhizophila]